MVTKDQIRRVIDLLEAAIDEDETLINVELARNTLADAGIPFERLDGKKEVVRPDFDPKIGLWINKRFVETEDVVNLLKECL